MKDIISINPLSKIYKILNDLNKYTIKENVMDNYNFINEDINYSERNLRDQKVVIEIISYINEAVKVPKEANSPLLKFSIELLKEDIEHFNKDNLSDNDYSRFAEIFIVPVFYYYIFINYFAASKYKHNIAIYLCAEVIKMIYMIKVLTPDNDSSIIYRMSKGIDLMNDTIEKLELSKNDELRSFYLKRIDPFIEYINKYKESVQKSNYNNKELYFLFPYFLYFFIEHDFFIKRLDVMISRGLKINNVIVDDIEDGYFQIFTETNHLFLNIYAANHNFYILNNISYLFYILIFDVIDYIGVKNSTDKLGVLEIAKSDNPDFQDEEINKIISPIDKIFIHDDFYIRLLNSEEINSLKVLFDDFDLSEKYNDFSKHMEDEFNNIKKECHITYSEFAMYHKFLSIAVAIKSIQKEIRDIISNENSDEEDMSAYLDNSFENSKILSIKDLKEKYKNKGNNKISKEELSFNEISKLINKNSVIMRVSTTIQYTYSFFIISIFDLFNSALKSQDEIYETYKELISEIRQKIVIM